MVSGTEFRDFLAAGTGSQGASSVLGGDQSTSGTSSAKKAANDKIGKNEFLNLLVTQLKNQDPMDPVKNDQFAVNLAQFSQLEQLMSINDKVGQTTSDLGSLAAYLGHEVTLNTDKVSVANHDGGTIKFNLPQDAASVKVQLVDPITGQVQENMDLGAMNGGKHTVQLSNLSTLSGAYQVKVSAIGTIGGSFDAPVHAAGLVNGFIPGPTPKLLTASGEIDPADVIEVSVPSQG